MNVGPIHFGATPRSAAYAAADVAHVPAGLSITGQAAQNFQVSNVRPVAPVENSAEAREQARRQVMAERGVDMVSLFKLPPQQRLQAEAAILAETARRAAAPPLQATGALVDLRI